MNILSRLNPFGGNRMYYNAIRLYNRFQYPEAIEKFNTILARKKRANSLHQTLTRVYCGQAHRNQGEIYLVIGDYGNASEECTAALEFDPNNMQLNKYLGVCLGYLDRYEEAYSALTKVLQQDPTLLSPESKLAAIFFNLRLWDKAEKKFSEILKQNPGYADIHFLRGVTYQGKGLIPEAVRAFTKALEINSAYSRAQIKLSISLAYMGKVGEALSVILPVAEKFSSHADIHYTCAVIYSAGNEMQKSIKYFRKAIEINPVYKKARIGLGMLLLRMGRTLEGLTELESVYRDDPADNALKTMIHTLKGMSDSTDSDARKLFSRLKATSEEKKREAGKPKGMIGYLTVAPGFSDMLAVLKAMPHDETFILEKLIPLLTETISLHPAYCDIHNSLGTFYIKIGQYEKAVESFREARRINPGYIKARINLFNALKENRDLDASMEAGIELYEKELPYPDFRCAVGEVYLSLEKFEKALEVVNKVLDEKPDFPPAHFLLAQIYNKKGDTDKAAETLRKCLD